MKHILIQTNTSQRFESKLADGFLFSFEGIDGC
jgi:hypothetical protein